MAEISRSGRHQELFGRLVRLSGHFDVTSAQDDDALRTLHETLAGALAENDLASARTRAFFVEQSDLFSEDMVTAPHRDRLDLLSARTAQQTEAPDLRVFVRDVPLRTTEMEGSVPSWAAGAAVDQTMGPFLGRDGRQIWFDFFKITRLVALYLAGQPDPVLLFDVAQRKRFTQPTLPPAVDPQTRYHLAPDSVWVKSSLFAANAPPGMYTGFRISSGEIGLGAPPALVNGKLTVPAFVTVSVTLVLEQPVVTDADPTSPYGIDARNAALHLPKRLAFHCSTAGSAIDAITGHLDWRIYGQDAEFAWNSDVLPTFDPRLGRVLIPLTCSAQTIGILDCQSPFTTYAGSAGLQRSAWALPVAQIDVTKPSPAAGIGGIAVQAAKGLAVRWPGLQRGDIKLLSPFLVQDPGRIVVADAQAGNAFCTQEYALWTDDVNPHGASVKLQYTSSFPFAYSSDASGTEALLAFANANPLLDRPVTVTGRPFDIHSKGSTLVLAVGKTLKLLYLFDDNILFDNYDPQKPKTTAPQPLAIALHNALFKVTPVNGCLLFGLLADDMVQVERGVVFLTFGMHAYIPTLPDPYAANLNVLRSQFRRSDALAVRGVAGQAIWLWLVSQIRWEFQAPDKADVDVSFHFAPLQAPTQTSLGDQPFSKLLGSAPAVATSAGPDATATLNTGAEPTSAFRFAATRPVDTQALWDRVFSFFGSDAFALLDVSSNANQMGVSFRSFGDERMALLRTQAVTPSNEFPVQAQGLDVVARGRFVRAFTMPQISWEPIINLTEKIDPTDPPIALNYYPNDGGPSKLVNNSVRLVPLAPIPLCDFLVSSYTSEPGNVLAAYFTLPFGMRSLAALSRTEPGQTKRPAIDFNSPSFSDDLKGGIQLSLTAGSGFSNEEGDMFRGFTLQTNNVLDAFGTPTFASTLGEQVSFIFNQRFFQDTFHGVPVTRIDLSGYGASTASRWLKSDAQFADVSQCVFDILVGRTAHEVVQVKSMVYPWGIRVVRTITIFRVGSGYVYRVDSGWKADSDGRFDFRFKYVVMNEGPEPPGTEKIALPYKIHPGTIKGLFNIRNIRSAIADVLPFLGTMDVTKFYENGPGNKPIKYGGGPPSLAVNLQPVYFDADVELDNIIQGQAGGRVPTKKVLGFVQLSPRGIPLAPEALLALIDRQLGSIGGPLDAIMDIGLSGQRLRINRVDVNSSVDAAGVTPVFVAAARGSVILPKEGSWSLVTHAHGTGEVTPLPESATVPVIRIGELAANLTYSKTDLLRVANPADLLRAPGNQTVNFGFLQSTNTQKVLFLTPAFDSDGTETTPGKLLSKTPPLFVDAYRLVGSKAIFPNIGNAVTGFGDAIALTKDFVSSTLADGGKQVLELMSVNSADGINRLKEDGYKLLNAVKKFDLPATEWYLINEDYLKVYVEYKATTLNQDGKTTQARPGQLSYDVDSFAADVADRWKSRMNNLAMVVDLGPLKRLMTIKGNFDAKKGAEAGYVGGGDPDFVAPQIEFSKELQPVMDVLQILADLQGAKYGDAVKKGLKIAMSNNAGGWEYKFEASKEIPLLKFPVPDEVFNNPNTPLKLEASMKVGVYFNAALTTAALGDPKKLLPTAGAFLDFYGRLSVMCVSLSVATVYAVGQANVRIAGDTKVGPSLTLKFGFGAQIVVGLPVVGHVSVLYVVGVEIYADAGVVKVSAFLLFQGHAELLGGLVSVTITIEAKGTVSRTSLPGDEHTDVAAQVTFGLDISIFLVINISFSKSWQEQRQIA